MKVTVDGKTWRVWFQHRPDLQHGHGDQNATTLAYLCPDGEGWHIIGGATCSVKDIYSRSQGRKVALARALRNANFTKEQRAEVWKQLFKRGMKP